MFSEKTKKTKTKYSLLLKMIASEVQFPHKAQKLIGASADYFMGCRLRRTQ